MKYQPKLAIWHNDRSIQMDIADLNEVEAIIGTVEPGYRVMKWCQSCVGGMLDKAYKLLEL